MEYQKFEKGEVVRLDADFNNTSLVTVVFQTPERMFTGLESDDDSWIVMTDRLSQISSVNYGDDGVGLSSDEISKLF